MLASRGGQVKREKEEIERGKRGANLKLLFDLAVYMFV
jgi:hypothetical protein